jgi:hypothetical protein
MSFPTIHDPWGSRQAGGIGALAGTLEQRGGIAAAHETKLRQMACFATTLRSFNARAGLLTEL